MKPHEKWEVMPHGPLERVADNLYTVVGQLPMPLGTTPRRMSVVVLDGGRLAIYSAIALAEPEMQRLEALGRPTFLIVPSAIHRIDVRPWKDRYPGITVIAPEGARDAVGEVVAIDRTEADLGDPRARLEEVRGTAHRELSMLVESAHGKTLIVNDLIFNLPHMGGITELGLRLLGFGPGRPHMPALVRRKLVDDDAAVRAQLRAWAELDLERILPAHGAAIEHPRDTLLALAQR